MDAEVQNFFSAGLLADRMKCIIGFNYHGKRNRAINQGKIDDIYPPCQKTDDWEYIIQCNMINNQTKDKLVRIIGEEIQKLPKWEEDEKEIVKILIDIKKIFMI